METKAFPIINLADRFHFHASWHTSSCATTDDAQEITNVYLSLKDAYCLDENELVVVTDTISGEEIRRFRVHNIA